MSLMRFGYLAALLFCLSTATAKAQSDSSIVWQLVTFNILPGQYNNVIDLYQQQAVPLYAENEEMLRFRGFREVESPVPFGLMVLTEMHGLGGMDASNNRLRAIAAEQNISVGNLYGRISDLTAGHTDEFVQLIAEWKIEDPFTSKYQVFISYDIVAGKLTDFRRFVHEQLIPAEKELGLPSSGGEYIISAGWQYVRVFGIDTLNEFGDYIEMLHSRDLDKALDPFIDKKKIVIKGVLPNLSVR